MTVHLAFALVATLAAGFGTAFYLLGRYYRRVTLRCGVCTRVVVVNCLVWQDTLPSIFGIFCEHCCDEHGVSSTKYVDVEGQS